LTVSGAGQLVMNGGPVSVTTIAPLAVGTYVLINTNSGGTVTGTPGTLTFDGVSSPSFANVAVSGDQLVLNVTANYAIAPNLTYTVGAGAGVRILLSDLITSNGIYSSQVSPSWTIASAGPTSTQGGAVSNSTSQIQYTAPNSSITSDTFTYTLSDGTTTSGTATVTINFVQQSGGNATIAVSGSTASGKLFGIPGQNYGIERSTNTASGPYYLLSSPPLTNALPITAAGDGSVSFSDTNAPGTSAFYRLIQQ
jgi:hypothetical protein